MGGAGRAFDTTKFFIVCLNSLGSPYGTASPVTYVDGDSSRERYGPEFPLTTVRDDVKCVPSPCAPRQTSDYSQHPQNRSG